MAFVQLRTPYRLVIVVALLLTVILIWQNLTALQGWRPVPFAEPSSSPIYRNNTIVMARLSTEDTKWVADELPEWDRAIYTVDDSNATLTVPRNKGKESMAYLTYLIDHYTSLPNISIFLHSHKDGYPKAWHTDATEYSNVEAVRSLKLDYVKQVGYANMRCGWVPGCPDEIQPFRDEEYRTSEHSVAGAYRYMFGESAAVPEKIGAACCSQFAVSKERILARPLAEYVRFREWLLETSLDDDISGRVFEYFWHIIFGKDAVDCPEQNTCYCDVYGKC